MKREDVKKVLKAFSIPPFDEIPETKRIPWFDPGPLEIALIGKELEYQEMVIARTLLVAAKTIPQRLLKETLRGNLFVWVDKSLPPIRPHWLSCAGHRVRVFPPPESGENWTVRLEVVPHRILTKDDDMCVIDTSSCSDEALAWDIADGFVMDLGEKCSYWEKAQK